MVLSIAQSNDGKVYSASDDSTIRVWSAANGSHIGTLEGHVNSVNVVAVAADGMVYSGSDDGTLRVWSGLTGSPIRTLQMGDAVMTIATGAGNTVLFSVEGRICSWGGGAAPARTFYTCDNPASVIAIGHDGRLFITCSGDSLCVRALGRGALIRAHPILGILDVFCRPEVVSPTRDYSRESTPPLAVCLDHFMHGVTV